MSTENQIIKGDPLQPIREIIVRIQEKEGVTIPKKTIMGHVECPKCGKALVYRISSSSGHIWGQCSTKGCLNWIA